MLQSKKKKPTSAKKNYWFYGQISSNQYTLNLIPGLHDTFWQAAKLCSACKVEVSAQHAQELMDAVEAIHNMFWAVKGREVPWIRAS